MIQNHSFAMNKYEEKLRECEVISHNLLTDTNYTIEEIKYEH